MSYHLISGKQRDSVRETSLLCSNFRRIWQLSKLTRAVPSRSRSLTCSPSSPMQLLRSSRPAPSTNTCTTTTTAQATESTESRATAKVHGFIHLVQPRCGANQASKGDTSHLVLCVATRAPRQLCLLPNFDRRSPSESNHEPCRAHLSKPSLLHSANVYVSKRTDVTSQKGRGSHLGPSDDSCLDPCES
jgi:hypothetical protein